MNFVPVSISGYWLWNHQYWLRGFGNFNSCFHLSRTCFNLGLPVRFHLLLPFEWNLSGYRLASSFRFFITCVNLGLQALSICLELDSFGLASVRTQIIQVRMSQGRIGLEGIGSVRNCLHRNHPALSSSPQLSTRLVS